MTTEQEALRLAGELEAIVAAFGTPSSRNAERDSAAMLRKLVAEREADRAAMRDALEALEESIDLVREDYHSDWRHGLPTRKAQLDAIKASLDAHEAAITHLRQRLGE